MKRLYFLFIILTIIPVLVIPALAQQIEDIEEKLIPKWVKGVFIYWTNGDINDTEIINALEHLVDTNVIKLTNSSNTVLSEEPEVLSKNGKLLFETIIEQKSSKITDLEDEVKQIGLDNSDLVISITEITNSHNEIKAEFEKYKQDYPLKVGNIGGKMVTALTVKELIDRVDELEKINSELEEEIRKLKEN